MDDQGLEHWFDFSNPVKRGGTATSSHPFLKLSSKILNISINNYSNVNSGMIMML